MNPGRLPRRSRDVKNKLDFDMPSFIQRMAMSAFHEKAGSGLRARLKAERTGKPSVLQSTGSQRIRRDLVTGQQQKAETARDLGQGSRESSENKADQ